MVWRLSVVVGIDVYAQRGTYQIIIRGIRPQGIGALELAFRQLHERLAGEGLFDSSVKKELPSIPKHICVVTSPTSAAVRDFLQVLTRRWPRIRVTVVPVKVQGPGAAEEIAEAIGLCNRMGESVDVIASHAWRRQRRGFVELQRREWWSVRSIKARSRLSRESGMRLMSRSLI